MCNITPGFPWLAGNKLIEHGQGKCLLLSVAPLPVFFSPRWLLSTRVKYVGACSLNAVMPPRRQSTCLVQARARDTILWSVRFLIASFLPVGDGMPCLLKRSNVYMMLIRKAIWFGFQVVLLLNCWPPTQTNPLAWCRHSFAAREKEKTENQWLPGMTSYCSLFTIAFQWW